MISKGSNMKHELPKEVHKYKQLADQLRNLTQIIQRLIVKQDTQLFKQHVEQAQKHTDPLWNAINMRTNTTNQQNLPTWAPSQ